MNAAKKTCVIDALSLLAPMTGVSRFTYEICKRLDHPEIRQDDRFPDYTFFYGYPSRTLRHPQQENRESDTVSSFARRIRNRNVLKSVIRKGVGLSAMLLPKFDVYWEPNHLLLPIRARRIILTAHDLSCHIHPKWHPVERVENFRRRFKTSLRGADVIVTDAETVRCEIIETFDVDADRIVSIPPGVDHEKFRPIDAEICAPIRRRHSLPERFVLFVGSLEPRKNLRRLLEAYASIPEGLRRDTPLVIVGYSGWNNEELFSILNHMQKSVLLLGHISEEDLAGLYSLATVFVYPSLYEGFGLPPLEAMACGAPVVTSDIPVLRETCGDAALFTQPEDIDSIAADIMSLLSDEQKRRTRSRMGIEHAARYSWNATTDRYRALFGPPR
jgi:glycosyltransferase involved in cell wall biosynthesis